MHRLLINGATHGPLQNFERTKKLMYRKILQSPSGRHGNASEFLNAVLAGAGELSCASYGAVLLLEWLLE